MTLQRSNRYGGKENRREGIHLQSGVEDRVVTLATLSDFSFTKRGVTQKKSLVSVSPPTESLNSGTLGPKVKTHSVSVNSVWKNEKDNRFLVRFRWVRTYSQSLRPGQTGPKRRHGPRSPQSQLPSSSAKRTVHTRKPGRPTGTKSLYQTCNKERKRGRNKGRWKKTRITEASKFFFFFK